MRSDQEQPFTKAPEGQVGFEVDIDYHKNGTTKMNGHNAGKRLLWMQMAYQPACKVFGMNVPNNRNCGTNN